MVIVTTKLDGKQLSSKIRGEIKKRVDILKEHGITPCLAVVLVGNDSASQVYIRNKKRAAAKLGIKTFDKTLPASISEVKLIEMIEQLNQDESVHGILVQLPLPKSIDENHVIDAIDPKKDADGFHPVNIGNLFLDKATLVPCTPHGIIRLLKEYQIDLTGKNVVIVGRSKIVGTPLIAMMMKENATVTVAHSYTKNLKELTKKADVVIAAIGKGQFFDDSYFNENAVIVDVGTNRNENGQLVGDVDSSKVANKVAYLSPVPGGVGPMTITMLLEQTVQIAEEKLKDGTR